MYQVLHHVLFALVTASRGQRMHKRAQPPKGEPGSVLHRWRGTTGQGKSRLSSGLVRILDCSSSLFVSRRRLLGMARRPRYRALGVDSGPGEGGPEEVRGAPDSILSSSHIRILDFSFDGGTENVTKWHYDWSLCTIFRAGPDGRGPGAKFGRKTAENRPTL